MHFREGVGMEQVWQANETFAAMQAQKDRLNRVSPELLAEFPAQQAAYNVVGKRILSELVELAPDYTTALYVVVKKSLYESQPAEDETEAAIAWRSLARLTEALSDATDSQDAPRPQREQKPPLTVRPQRPPTLKELDEARAFSNEKLAALLRQGDYTAATVLDERFYWLTRLKAKQFSRRHFSRISDGGGLQQEARIAFLERAKDWPPDGKAQLASFAARGAEWRMKAWLNRENHLVNTGAASRMIPELASINDERLHEGKPPMNDAEIAEHFHIPLDGPADVISVRILTRAMQLTRALDSLDSDIFRVAPRRPQTRTDLDALNDAVSLVTDDLPGDPAEEVTEAITTSSHAAVMRQALHTLSPLRREVLYMRYGLNDDTPMSQVEIARLYGVSQQNISQIHLGGLRALRRTHQHILRNFLRR